MAAKLGRRAFIGAGLAAATGGAAFIARRRSEQIERLVFHQWLGRFRPEIRTLRLADLDESVAYDVCIVGSGPAGATLATELVDRGLRVLILESGASWSSPEGGTAGELDRYRSAGPLVYPLGGTRVRALGGTSSMWTGRSARLHPVDFAVNAYTPAGTSWPCSYQEIQEYYLRAERTLRVRGGEDSEFRAPRTKPLPGGFPVRHELVPLLDKLKLTGRIPPTSTSRWGTGPWRAHVDALPDLTESTDVDVVTRATVTRLEPGKGGRVSHAVVRDLDGTTRAVRAEQFVLACGGVENARLLLLSRSSRHPDGLGNDSGHVGRYFMEHPHLELTATIPYKLDAQWGASVTSHQHYDMLKGEDLGGLDLTIYLKNEPERNLVLRAVVEMEPMPGNRLVLSPEWTDGFGDPGVALSMDLSDRDRATLDRVRGILMQLMGRAGGVDIEEKEIGWGHHHIGTTRAGEDPALNVVDGDLRVHGTTNLYVVGSSVFVTSGGAHPTPLLVALTHRLADHLAPVRVA